MTLNYSFSSASADFDEGIVSSPSFGIALQLEQCTPLSNFLYYIRFFSGNYELIQLDPATVAQTVLFATATSPVMTAHLSHAPDGYFYAQDAENATYTNPVAVSSDGSSWSEPEPTINHIGDSCTSIDSSLWYAGEDFATGKFHVYRTVDHGVTNTILYDIETAGYFPLSFNARQCAVHPNDANKFAMPVYLVATGQRGIIVTTDLGVTWAFHAITGVLNSGTFTADIAWLNDGSIIVAGLIQRSSDSTDRVAIYRSTDLGATWSNFDFTQTTFAQGITQAVPLVIPRENAASNTAFVIISFEDNATVLYRRCYRSTDNGATWSDIGWPNSTNLWVLDAAYNQVTDDLYIWLAGGTPTAAIYKLENATTGTTWTHMVDEANLQNPSMVM